MAKALVALRTLYALARNCLRTAATMAICLALSKPLGLYLLWAGFRPGWFGLFAAWCISIYVVIAVSYVVTKLDQLLDHGVAELMTFPVGNKDLRKGAEQERSGADSLCD